MQELVIYLYIYACIYIYIYICICVYIYIYTHSHYICKSLYKYIYIYIYTHTHIFMYIQLFDARTFIQHSQVPCPGRVHTNAPPFLTTITITHHHVSVAGSYCQGLRNGSVILTDAGMNRVTVLLSFQSTVLSTLQCTSSESKRPVVFRSFEDLPDTSEQ